MSEQVFSAAARLAVYVVHGPCCYACGEPVDFASMELDHILPESLAGSAELPRILVALALSDSFDLKSYANVLPICRRCNLVKLAKVFRASPVSLLALDKAASGVVAVEREEAKTLSDRSLSMNLTKLLKAYEDGTLRTFIETREAHELAQQFERIFRTLQGSQASLGDSDFSVAPRIRFVHNGLEVRLAFDGFYIGDGQSKWMTGWEFMQYMSGTSGWGRHMSGFFGSLTDTPDRYLGIAFQRVAREGAIRVFGRRDGRGEHVAIPVLVLVLLDDRRALIYVRLG